MAGPRGSTRQSGRSAQAGGENLGPYLNRVVWSLAALSGLFLGLRVYCKLWRRRRLWWDDYVLIASWITLAASVTLQSVAISYGLGRRYHDLDVASISTLGLYSMCAGFFSILATCWSKTSFAMSLLRISTGGERVVVWFIIVTVNLVLGANGVIQWVQCWPVQKSWHYEMEGTCLPPKNVQDFNTFVAAFSGFMDFALALLPWKIILTATINKREKLGALVAMSTGILAGVMSLLKIKTLYVIGNGNDLFIFGTAEPATAIMAASIPVLRALIRRDSAHKPAQFIELSQAHQRCSPPPTLDSPSNGRDEKNSARESWSHVVHAEQQRVCEGQTVKITESRGPGWGR